MGKSGCELAVTCVAFSETMQSSPITYELDERQYVVTGNGGVLFSCGVACGSLTCATPSAICYCLFCREHLVYCGLLAPHFNCYNWQAKSRSFYAAS